MEWHTKYLIGLTSALLLAIFLPSPVQAQSLGVSPAEVEISNLSPGDEAKFDLTIRNKDDVSHTFIISTYNPVESQRRQGRAEFPDKSWVSFPQQVEVQANSTSEVEVKVAIPSAEKWANRDWEIWLGVAPMSGDLLTAKLYVRFLVSTSGEVGTGKIGTNPSKQLIVGTVVGMALLIYGIYRLRKEAKAPKT